MAGFAEQAQVSPKYYKPFDERGEVADKIARNAIPRKFARMRVVTLDDQAGWRLKACPGGQSLSEDWGTLDSHWESADVSALAAGSVDDSMLATDVKVGSLATLRGLWGAVGSGFTSVKDFLANLLTRTAALETKTANLSGTNTGDQDISGIAVNAGALNTHIADHANPHVVTATQVGLGNVTNDAQVKRTELGTANGVATLDTGGKVPATQLPDSILGALKYKGTYNFAANRISSADSALNNTTLPTAAAGNLGYYFIVLDTGVLNSKIYNTGDWLLSNGAAGWTCIDNTDAVTMVAGRIGNVVLTTADVSEDSSKLYFTEARVLATKLAGYVKDTAYAAFTAGTTTVLQWMQQMEFRVDSNTTRLTAVESATAANSLQIFTASGTWTKPANAKFVRVVMLGGGGGGGGGCSAAYGSVISGGGGGGGGGRNILDIDASLLPATVAITVGAAGAGGAGLSSAVTGSVSGNTGTAGGDSLFGNFGKGKGGTAGGAGLVGNTSGTAGQGGGALLSGGNGGSGTAQQTPGVAGNPIFLTTYAPSGGGGGGGGSGYDGTGTTGGGGAGGVNCLTEVSGTTLAATIGGGAATNGSTTPAGTSAASISAKLGIGANGGAGGSSTRFGTYGPGNGGSGGFPAGGGGGAGGAYTGAASGSGGNGGAGVVLVFTY